MDKICTTHKERIVPAERKFTRGCNDDKSLRSPISASQRLTASVTARDGAESTQQSPPQDMLPNTISSIIPTVVEGSSASLRKPPRELLRETCRARNQLASIAAPC